MVFGGMGIIIAVLELSKNNKDRITTSQDFSSFKNNYLLVYSLMMAGDWLQGPYVYYLYTTYGYGKGDIGQLFIVGFGSSMPFGTIVGSLADKEGRKCACITYWITYILSCMTKHSPQYKVLLFGHILGGVATSLLFSAFESWLVAEHNKVLRTVQADGIRGLSKAELKAYGPPAGSGFIPGFTSISYRPSKEMSFSVQSIPFGPTSYLFAQARVVEEYTVSQIILQAVTNGGANGMLVVVTGASHVAHGSRGTGVPARIARKMQKKNQTVIFLDPERQYIRREGEVHVVDFLWYSAARPCTRNCFDSAKIARVMNAAGRRRDALPQDIQTGLDLGLVSPEVL